MTGRRWTRALALARACPVGPALVVPLVVLGALFPASALVDAVTLEAVPWARLAQPWSYLAGAPLFGVLDALSLLTVGQHYAVLATLALLFLLRRATAPRATGSALRRVVVEALRVAAGPVALVAVYAVAALAPRPMVRLALSEADLVAVDFHSHTLHSHDGRASFDAERNRAWHEAGGFHAAYATDHYTWAGVDEAAPGNPRTAGEGTVLLSGMEVRLRDRHVNVLGDRARYEPALDSSGRHLDPDALVAARRRGEAPATMLYALPGPLEDVVALSPSSPAGVVAIEISDGAPRGLEQVRSERAEILRVADEGDLALVAGSNLHGWGRTVAAWTVVRLPGWRSASPERLGERIEATLHRERRSATAVVERRMPYHEGSRLALAATLPRLAWEHMRMLSLGERVSWLLWAAVWAAASARRRRGGRPAGA